MCLAASHASAQDAPRDARLRFERGVELFDRGDYDAALSEFRASHRARAVPGVLVNIALALRRLGRDAEAAEALREYLVAGDPRLSARRRRQIEEEIREIEGSLGELVVHATPDDADTLVDGRIVEGSAPIRLREGTHELDVHRDGFEPARRRVAIRAGSRETVRVVLERTAARATLELTSAPPGAAVAIDGSPRGVTPLSEVLGAGGHHLRLTLGDVVTEREVVLEAQETLRLSISMGGGSILEEWWLWTLLGVVVAGGIAGAVVGVVVSGGGPSAQDAPMGTIFNYP